MDIGIKIEHIREVCDKYVEDMEKEFESIGICISESDRCEILDLILSIAESDLTK